MKWIIYIWFVALATLCAEVLSFNNPTILLDPTGYLAYGLLLILFLHTLITKQISDWKIVYLQGVLIGLFTEGFFAKVLFFGGEADSLIILGYAIPEAPFLAFFFHPIYSFILPLWIAKDVFQVPLALKTPKTRWLIVIFAQYILTTTSLVDISSVLFASISIIIFWFWTLLLQKKGETKTVALNIIEKSIIHLLFVLVYTVAYFTFPVLGHDEVLLPSFSTIIGFTIGIVAIILLIRKNTKPRKTEIVQYKPQVKMSQVTLPCLATLGLTALLTVSGANFFFAPLVWIQYLLGAIGGTITFTIIVYKLVKNRSLL
jgi:hypothetical protein